MSGPEKLAVEVAFFEKHRQEWLTEHAGKYALIRGEALIDTFDTAENAYVAGVERFGNTLMLIKQVLSEDPEEQQPALVLGLISVRP